MALVLDYFTALQLRQQSADQPVTVCFGGIDNPATAIPVGVFARDPIAAAQKVGNVRCRQSNRVEAYRKAQQWRTAAIQSHERQQGQLQSLGIDFNPENWGSD